jgi:hypothetical protein
MNARPFLSGFGGNVCDSFCDDSHTFPVTMKRNVQRVGVMIMHLSGDRSLNPLIKPVRIFNRPLQDEGVLDEPALRGTAH